MANEEKEVSPKRRIVRKAETIREQAAKQAQTQPKKRGVIRTFLHYISWPLRMLGRGIKWVGHYIVPPYFKKSWQELKQVTWPSTRDTWKLTLAVIVFSVVFGVLITIVDFLLDKVFKKVILS